MLATLSVCKTIDNCPHLVHTFLAYLLCCCCSEGILWHVLTTPTKISQSLLMRYKEAVGDLHCQGDHEGHGDSEESGPKKSDADKKKADTTTPFPTNGTYFTLPPASKSEC
jgi:hypothetical protein